MAPDHFSGCRIQGEHVGGTRRGTEIHPVADHQGRRLLRMRAAQGVDPGNLQVLDIAGVDLVERAVARVGIVTPVDRPLLAAVGRCHRCHASSRQGDGAGQKRPGDSAAECAPRHGHGFPPQLIARADFLVASGTGHGRSEAAKPGLRDIFPNDGSGRSTLNRSSAQGKVVRAATSWLPEPRFSGEV